MRLSILGRRLFLLVICAALGLALYSWGRGHPQHVPWTPLSLADAIGPFTRLKLERLDGDLAGCRALLDAAGEAYAPLASVRGESGCGYDDAVRLTNATGFGYDPPAGLTCRMAAGLFLWEKQIVEPAAIRHFGVAVRRIETFGTYSCRSVRGGDGRLSEHARANAIDVAAFRLADGRRIGIASHWTSEGAEAAFLRDVRDGACRIFTTTLSPDYNRLHRDHLHLDHAGRDGWGFCR